MSIKTALRTGAMTVTVLAAIGFVKWWLLEEQERPKPCVNDFDSCVEAGHVVFENDPRKCRAHDGVVYVEDGPSNGHPPSPSGIDLS